MISIRHSIYRVAWLLLALTQCTFTAWSAEFFDCRELLETGQAIYTLSDGRTGIASAPQNTRTFAPHTIERSNLHMDQLLRTEELDAYLRLSEADFALLQTNISALLPATDYDSAQVRLGLQKILSAPALPGMSLLQGIVGLRAQYDFVSRLAQATNTAYVFVPTWALYQMTASPSEQHNWADNVESVVSTLTGGPGGVPFGEVYTARALDALPYSETTKSMLAHFIQNGGRFRFGYPTSISSIHYPNFKPVGREVLAERDDLGHYLSDKNEIQIFPLHAYVLASPGSAVKVTEEVVRHELTHALVARAGQRLAPLARASRGTPGDQGAEIGSVLDELMRTLDRYRGEVNPEKLLRMISKIEDHVADHYLDVVTSANLALVQEDLVETLSLITGSTLSAATRGRLKQALAKVISAGRNPMTESDFIRAFSAALHTLNSAQKARRTLALFKLSQSITAIDEAIAHSVNGQTVDLSAYYEIDPRSQDLMRRAAADPRPFVFAPTELLRFREQMANDRQTVIPRRTLRLSPLGASRPQRSEATGSD